MKKLFFAAFILAALSFKHADAQLSISINIGSQPDWGPTGYDHVDYYYMPDIDCYYDVPNKQYVYMDGNRWTRASALPPRYKNFDLYHGYKVVVNKPQPWTHAAVYRKQYSSFKGRRDQGPIRDSRDAKYRRPQNNNRPQQGRNDHQNNNHDDHGRHDDHH